MTCLLEKRDALNSLIHRTLAPSSGGACLLSHRRGHPRALGQDGVVPGRHASQRWAAGPAQGPTESLDVESDPGERPSPFPKSPQCQRSSTPPGGEGHQWGYLSRPGCWPASERLLFIITCLEKNSGTGWMCHGSSGPLCAKKTPGQGREYVTLTLWYAQKEAAVLFLLLIWNLKYLRQKSPLPQKPSFSSL